MRTSKAGINFIKSFEGCLLTESHKLDGVPTIGYGHTGTDVKIGMKITPKKAEQLLKKDLKKFESYVNALKYKLKQNEFDALVSFTYNCGCGNLRNLTKAGTRSKREIANAIIRYNKCNGKVLKGLQRRRKAEQYMFLGTYGK